MKHFSKYISVCAVFALALCGVARGIGLHVVSYHVSNTGTVTYEYRGVPLPQKLSPDEDVALRTASSFTERVGTAPDGRPVYRLTSYTSPHFIAENGMWYERRAATTTETAFFLAHPDRAVASALSAAVAYAASFSGFASSGDGYSAVTNTGDIDFPVAGIDDCQSGNSGNSLDASNYTNTTGIVSVNYISGGFGSCVIRRAFLPFDTSSITAGSTVTAATMALYATAKTNNLTTGDDLYLVQAPSDAYFPNFGAAAGATNINMGSITTSAYNTWTLNSTGFAWITAAGTTYLGVREQHDISDFMTAGTNSVTFSTSENTGTSQDPTLSVTYTPPSAPTISSSAATSITATSAVLNGSMSANGGIDPTTCGFAWGTDATLSGGNTATTTDSTCPTGSGSFNKTVTTLVGTTYYFRAYATNTGGTGYGSILNFTSSKKALAKPPNNLGLIAYWPFNEGTTTLAGDFSGLGNNGTLSGATKPVWTNGVRGGALSFDGSTSYVISANTTGISGAASRTVTAWIKMPSSAGSFTNVVSMGGSSDTHAFELLTTNGSAPYGICLHIYGTDQCSTSIIAAGAWYNVAITYNGTTAIFYINGVSAGSWGVGALSTDNSVVSIGNNGTFGGVSFFPGTLDDVRIYSRALSATEIASLYHYGTSGAARGNASSKTLQNGTTLGNGLVGLWTFDGGALNWTSASAGVAYDMSGNNNTGTLTNMTRAGSVAIGKLGQALLFDGVDDQVTIAGPALTTTHSIAMWIYPTASSAGCASSICALFALSGSQGLVWTTGNKVQYIGGGAGPDAISGALSLNTWTHVAVSVSGGSSILYINGASVDTGSNVTAYTPDRIGGDTSFTQPFSGRIDDVRAYNRALSATEVTQLYKLGKVLVKP